jgi:hypothetical protein
MLSWFILKKSTDQHIGDNYISIINIKRLQKVLPFAVISGIGVFGLVKSTTLTMNNINFPITETTAFASHYLQSNSNHKYDNNTVTVADRIYGVGCESNTTTVISYPIYSWILKYVFHFNNFVNYNDFSPVLVKTKKIILIADWAFENAIATKDKPAVQIQKIYHLDNTNLIAKLEDNTTHIPISIYQLENSKCR